MIFFGILTILMAAALGTTWARPSSGTYRYVPKQNSLGAFLDGNSVGGSRTALLPRSASTFFASQIRDRAYERRRNSGVAELPAASAAAQSSGGEDAATISGSAPEQRPAAAAAGNEPEASLPQRVAEADDAPAGGTELSSGRLSAAGGSEQRGSGKFARKNCFFSPLQCSFYYKKRSHHHSHPHRQKVQPATADQEEDQ